MSYLISAGIGANSCHLNSVKSSQKSFLAENIVKLQVEAKSVLLLLSSNNEIWFYRIVHREVDNRITGYLICMWAREQIKCTQNKDICPKVTVVSLGL